MLCRFKKSIFVCDQAKKKRSRQWLGIKFMCTQVLYNSSPPSFLFSSAYVLYSPSVKKYCVKYYEEMMANIIQATVRVCWYITLLKAHDTILELYIYICKSIYMYLLISSLFLSISLFLYQSIIVRMNEFHLGYAFWSR